MSRPLRITYEGAWYHIMNRGISRNNIFYEDSHREIFLNLLSDIHDEYHAETHAYCLMDNHYHLMIRTPLGNISRIMRHLNGVYTQRFNRLTGRDGPLFRGRFRSILIDADDYCIQLSRYIHLNPVSTRLVKNPQQFFWSSYQAYLSGRSPDWLCIDTVLSYFGNGPDRTKKYRIFVENNNEEIIWDIKNVPLIGTDEFIRYISKNYIGPQHKIPAIPAHKLLTESKLISIQTILTIVASFYGLSVNDLKLVRKKSSNTPRAVAVYVSRCLGHAFTLISQHFSDLTPGAASMSCQRLKEKINISSSLKEQIEELRQKILITGDVL